MNTKNTFHNKELGDFGEELVAKKLVQNGFFILEKNKKLGYSEIDLIAKKGEKIRFVEVKTRGDISDFCEAEYSIKGNKLKSLKRGMVKYCILNKIGLKNIHLDLAVVILDRNKGLKELRYYQDIF